MDGEPLQLVDEDNYGNLTFNDKVADQILRNKEVVNRLVAVISITGSEREGKSFLLNYIGRSLASDDPINRFGFPEQPLNGFLFKGGRKKQTRGIVVWSKPFIRKFAKNKEVAVILMDTQGVFGKKTSNDALILAFCSFVSSIQIYNVQSQFQTDNLEQLNIFLRYARNSSFSENIKVFQKLVILVRDWKLDDNYGFKGGNDHLSELLAVPENNDIAQYFESSFSEQVSCYLMPNPGNTANSSNFKGSLKELPEVFVDHLKNFITLLTDEFMMSKKIAGHEVTGERLCRYFKDCFDVTRDKKPLMKMTESYIKSICDDIISEMRGQYGLTYKKFIGEKISQSYLEALHSVKDFASKRNELLKEAEQGFLMKSKLTGKLYYQHLDTLRNELQIAFDAVEESYLKNLCERTIRLLEYYYCETMRTFAHRWFLSYLITSEKKLKKKHESLMSKVKEEFANQDENSRNWCFTRLENKLISSLSKHKKRRIKGWFKVAGAGVVLASSGITMVFGIISAVAATGAAGAAAAGAAANAAGKAAAGAAGDAAGAAAGVAAGAAGGAAGAAGGAVTKAGADVIFKIAQGGLFIAAGVGGVSKGVTDIANTDKDTDGENDTDKDSDSENVKEPDPESIFFGTLKILIVLIEKYLSVGGNVAHLVRNEEILTE